MGYRFSTSGCLCHPLVHRQGNWKLRKGKDLPPMELVSHRARVSWAFPHETGPHVTHGDPKPGKLEAPGGQLAGSV